MVTSAYDLNTLIPNIEMVFYRIFCSPLTNIEERKLKEKSNILAENIFAQKKVSLTLFGYRSLLETLSLYPKKKHFKKVITYLQEYEEKSMLNEEILNLII